jgi:two-component system, NtrC family, response regulator GlrR
VERCVVLSTTTLIPISMVLTALNSADSDMLPLEEARKEFERGYLTKLLKITRGNVAMAAKIAHRNRTDFYALMARHALDAASFKN